jgi:hypothetical protein
VFIGLTRGLLWVDADIQRRSPGQIVQDTVTMCGQHQPDAVGIESNGFQTVLGDLFDNYCSQNNMPPLPLHMIHNSEKKEVRIERLDPRLARGQLRFAKSPGCRLLVEQLMMFPLKDYKKDGPDALEMADRLLCYGLRVTEPVEEFITT